MSVLMELTDASRKLDGTRAKLAELMEKKTTEGKLNWGVEDHDSFKALQKQAGDEHLEKRKWLEIDEADRENKKEIADSKRPISGAPLFGITGAHDHRIIRKSVGELVTGSLEYLDYKSRNNSGHATVHLADYGVDDFAGSANYKTVMSGSAGFSPFVNRSADVVPFALRRPTVQDLMPSIPTSESAVKYMEETTNTRSAAAVAEAAAKPESARAYTERTVLVEVIATTLPVTEQQLSDVPQLMGVINATLGQEIELAEEDQILTGNGTSPQLQGFLTKTGVQTQAKGADPVPTAFVKAMTLIRFTGFAEPSAAVWHPNDWQDVVTLQDADGRYIFGDPSSSGIKQIWGVPAVVTPAETENTVLIGDFRMYSYLARRMGLRIDVGYVNDDFKKNLKTIRAETRLALVIRRPAAFCKLTGA